VCAVAAQFVSGIFAFTTNHGVARNGGSSVSAVRHNRDHTTWLPAGVAPVEAGFVHYEARIGGRPGRATGTRTQEPISAETRAPLGRAQGGRKSSIGRCLVQKPALPWDEPRGGGNLPDS
jgi:hypothetical protein